MAEHKIGVGSTVRARPSFDPTHWQDCAVVYVHPRLRFAVVEYNLDKRGSCPGEHLRRRVREAVRPEDVRRCKQ